jgi:hypothetical protein
MNPIQAVLIGYDPRSGECNALGYLPNGSTLDALLRERPGMLWVEKKPEPLDENVFGQVFSSAKMHQRGPLIAKYQGHDIADFVICEDGQRYNYEGIAPSWHCINAMDYGVRILAPGIIYRKAL